MNGLSDLLELLGYEPGEYLSLNYQRPGGKFCSEVVEYGPDVEAKAMALADGANAWFGVNPTKRRPVDENGNAKGRGSADDVTRLAAIWCDLDVKPGACRDLAHAHQVIDELSAILGTRPSAVVMSGNGLQPYWPIDDGQISDARGPEDVELEACKDIRSDAAALLKRWGRLACIVADGLGAKIDRGVYDLARVLRVPGSYNMKDANDPKPVTITADTGAPLGLEELRERLDEHGVAEYEGDRRTSHEVISKPDTWQFAPTTCEYFAPTIKAWAEEPITERHPWLVRVTVRLMAAVRNKCLTADEYAAARKMIVDKFMSECARTGRDVPSFEIPNAFAWAETHVATKTDAELATEFGSHLHLWQRAEPRQIELAPMSADNQQTAGEVPPGVSSEGSLAPVVDLNARRNPVAAAVTLTDSGNADLLVEAWSDRLRYCPDTGKWLSWQGTRWEHGTDQGEAIVAARRVIEAIRVDDDSPKDLIQHRMRSLSRKGLENMVALAKCAPQMRVRLADLDAEPYQLNTPSGVVDLTTGHLLPHSPDGWHTKITGAGYNPGVAAPAWQEFLDNTFGGDDELIGYVQRLAGLAAIGKVTHHVLPFLFGGGSNGKSVLMDVLSSVLGDYAITAPANFLLAGRDRHETEIARLHGARMVVCSEINADSKFDEAKVKVLTGGDTLSGRYMRQDYFDFTPSHTLFLMGNHQPEVSAGGTSFWRRLRLIPFMHTVPPERRNPNLAAELIRDEGAAILAWVVAGARQIAADGLREPRSVLDATKEYSEQEDALGRFIAECCVLTPGASGGAKPALVLRAYQRWAMTNGEDAMVSQVKLGRELSARFGVRSVASNGSRVYAGLSLQPGWDLSNEVAGGFRR
ncbi:DNA primase/helicase [Mycobacterium phage LilPharaoh]|uniref:DNA primase/helicase n=1 Tax=Mycobacterium phage Amelie TaxID=1913035 RepID=A0A1J0GPZ3_9CAUD|nr:DNA polymerase/primase [Mycobacterium phage Enkosi]YP_009952575.1 DNA polymerase/primase [Mycobacterium phage Amelie]ATN90511.1 DNA primase/helicase [Mycobacterium phage LilPharaoh]AVP42635.1 DNA primase/helicase [Mycobacterium phage SgtBeansprout]AXC37163.1 DNA primase/helicase [Mycobacterium phage Biglebops]QGJ93342.1 DNA primase/helicase [Mycobacterium phage Mdavu]UQS94457.1 DNA primase/helicase [Mycobacterium phage Nutello]UXE03220.1 DNA primase/helicase [Mycobacterium phage Nikao]